MYLNEGLINVFLIFFKTVKIWFKKTITFFKYSVYNFQKRSETKFKNLAPLCLSGKKTFIILAVKNLISHRKLGIIQVFVIPTFTVY
jgi:hypothetical protein